MTRDEFIEELKKMGVPVMLKGRKALEQRNEESVRGLLGDSLVDRPDRQSDLVEP